MSGQFADQLAAAVLRLRNPVLVGLDPHWDRLPRELINGGDDSLPSRAEAYRRFCYGVTDVVSPLVPAVKVQAAFFEELGPAGMAAMGEVILYAQERGLLVIVDGKRNDIGNTASAYARGFLGRGQSAWQADAITVSPYLGDDSLTPFVEVASRRQCGIFILVKTSNTGSGTFQDLRTGDQPLYAHVSQHVQQLALGTIGSCGYGAVGAVVGATYPQQLAELRALMPNAWLLVPGYGSQGGTAADVAAAFDARGLGAIINNSRGIIFAYERPEFAAHFGHAHWQDAVEAATRAMIDELRTVISTTP